MSNTEFGGLTVSMWLLMLEQGGRWTTSQMAQKLNVPMSKAERMAYFMVRSKCATKYRRQDRKNGVAYGVTNDNTVPRDMKLDDLLKAAGIRIWDQP